MTACVDHVQGWGVALLGSGVHAGLIFFVVGAVVCGHARWPDSFRTLLGRAFIGT